jgi:flavodoxin
MKALIIYDSIFGQTERIARAVAGVLAEQGMVQVMKASDMTTFDLKGADALLLAGPTHAHGVSQAMKALVQSIPKDALRGANVAAFATRIHIHPLLSGSAAGSLASSLRKCGGTLVVPPESFFVKSIASPPAEGIQDGDKGKRDKPAKRAAELEAGELERSVAWARTLLARLTP